MRLSMTLENWHFKTRALFRCWAPSKQITMLFCVSIWLTRFTWPAFHAPQLSVINSKWLLHNGEFLCLGEFFIPHNRQVEISGLFYRQKRGSSLKKVFFYIWRMRIQDTCAHLPYNLFSLFSTCILWGSSSILVACRAIKDLKTLHACA